MTPADDEMRQVLQRAAELERMAPLGPADVDTLLHAADQVGIPRTAIERALRERQVQLPIPPTIGQPVFARSADDNYYVAEVTATAGDTVTIRFLRGGERTVPIDDVKPCSFLPGERVQVKWPGWGNWTCTVVSYDVDRKQLTVTDGWSESRIFEIADVWINPRKAVRPGARSKMRAALIGAAAAGAAIGSLITALVIG